MNGGPPGKHLPDQQLANEHLSGQQIPDHRTANESAAEDRAAKERRAEQSRAEQRIAEQRIAEERHADERGAEERIARVALAHLVEPGNHELASLVDRFGAATTVRRLLAGAASERLAGAFTGRLAARRVAQHVDGLVELADTAYQRADRLGARIVTPADDEWPPQLQDLARIADLSGRPVDRDTDPPLCLWVRGAAALSDAFERSVAIVGARASTSYGEHVAAELACGLAERDWTVVSGGAFGIDAAAHRAAMASGGLTVAVLACGIDRPYPVSHTSLFERIVEEGLLISEWPPGSAPHRQRFLTRNRVIAAATRGTVVVEAAGRSGSRQTLGRARLLGRIAMAVPGPVTSAMSVGCHAELRDPQTRLVSNVEELLEEVGPIGALAPIPRGPARPHDSLDPLAARVLDAVLPRKARSAEEIAAVAGISGREARRTMPLLEMNGFVVQYDGGYRLAPPTPRDRKV